MTEQCSTCGARSPAANTYCSDGFHAPGPTYWPMTEHPTDATVTPEMIEAAQAALPPFGFLQREYVEAMLVAAMNAARTTPIDDEGLVEKVARAVYGAAYRVCCGEAAPESDLSWQSFEPEARAAIEAMRASNVS